MINTRALLAMGIVFCAFSMSAFSETFHGTITDGEPCAKADLLRSDHGHYELLPRQTKHIHGRVSITGVVYPKASICKIYPFLRIEKIASSTVATQNPSIMPRRSASQEQHIAKILIYTTKSNAGKAMATAVKIKNQHPEAQVILKVSGGSLEAMAELAVAMAKEHITYPKGLDIAQGGNNEPDSGAQVIFASGATKNYANANEIPRA